MGDEARQERTTFLSRTPSICPVCKKEFRREELLTGRGRLNAGDLQEDLRRRYLPSKKYGEVLPLLYPVSVCPNCWCAALSGDFPETKDAVDELKDEEDARRQTVALIVQDVDFTRPRTLPDGVASYILALMCYEHLDERTVPTFKRGLCALRCAWCLNDLHERNPGESYDVVAALMCRKARFFYGYALETMTTGREDLESLKGYGPDTDNNWGFDGFLYLNGLLELRYGPRQDRDKRLKALETSKRTVAKIFGMGRASKGKPSAILDLARDLHEKIGAEIKTMEAE